MHYFAAARRSHGHAACVNACATGCLSCGLIVTRLGVPKASARSADFCARAGAQKPATSLTECGTRATSYETLARARKQSSRSIGNPTLHRWVRYRSGVKQSTRSLTAAGTVSIFTLMVKVSFQLNEVFGAVADPIAARYWRARDADARVTDLAKDFPISLTRRRSTPDPRARRPRAAHGDRRRDHVLSLNAAPERAAQWIEHYRQFWSERLAALDSFVQRKRAGNHTQQYDKKGNADEQSETNPSATTSTNVRASPCAANRGIRGRAIRRVARPRDAAEWCGRTDRAHEATIDARVGGAYEIVSTRRRSRSGIAGSIG